MIDVEYKYFQYMRKRYARNIHKKYDLLDDYERMYYLEDKLEEWNEVAKKKYKDFTYSVC